MNRLIGMVYGIACYLAFQTAFLYLIGFLANLWVPKGIDGGASGSLATALAVDIALIVVFGLQHSVMARPAFKARLTRAVPSSLERSTYVLATAAVLGMLYYLWQPLPQVVWRIEAGTLRTALWTLFVIGNLLIFSATFMIDHFDLFGLRQVYARWRSRSYRAPPFRIAYLYRFVRHPLYLGFFMVFWATPDMTLGHLVFALGMSAYILVGVRFEERDLLAAFGVDYADYQARVPMVLPRPGRGACPYHVRGASRREY